MVFLHCQHNLHTGRHSLARSCLPFGHISSRALSTSTAESCYAEHQEFPNIWWHLMAWCHRHVMSAWNTIFPHVLPILITSTCPNICPLNCRPSYFCALSWASNYASPAFGSSHAEWLFLWFIYLFLPLTTWKEKPWSTASVSALHRNLSWSSSLDHHPNSNLSESAEDGIYSCACSFSHWQGPSRLCRCSSWPNVNTILNIKWPTISLLSVLL